MEQAQQSGAFLPSGLQGFPMVLVDESPLLSVRELLLAMVDEVTAISVTTESLLDEGVAVLGLVRPISLHIYSQLLRAVSKLASIAVGTVAFSSEVFAEGAFGLGC